MRAHLSSLQNKMLTRQLMKRLSLQAITLIFERTVEEGKDKNDRPFTEYSKSYLATKLERGAQDFHGKVNLFDKGHMLGDLDHTVVSKSSAFLHFPKIKERLKASGHIKGHRRLRKRDFFGLTKTDEKTLIEMVDKHLEEMANG